VDDGPRARSRVALVATIFVGALLALAVAGCATTPRDGQATAAGAQIPAGQLTVIVRKGGSDAEVIRTFKRDYPQVRLHVVRCDGDKVVERLEGGLGADVVEVSSDDTLPVLVSNALVQAIETERLTAWDAVVPSAKRFPSFFKDGHTYAAPTAASVIGLVSLSSRRSVGSLADLFSRRMLNKVAMPDRAVLGLDIGALALGYDVGVPLSDADLQNVMALYGDHEDNFKRFWSTPSELAHLLRSRTVLTSPCELTQAAWLRHAGLGVILARPTDGLLASMRGFAITSRAVNLAAVYAFLDCALSRTVQQRAAEASLVPVRDDVPFFSSPLTAATSTLDVERLLRGVRPVVRPDRYDTWIVAWEQAKKKGRG
jgi:spermidine/putrescine-binding protein